MAQQKPPRQPPRRPEPTVNVNGQSVPLSEYERLQQSGGLKDLSQGGLLTPPGTELPDRPVSEHDLAVTTKSGAEFAAHALPQAAGFASMIPGPLQTGKAAFAIPTLVELVRQQLQGEESDVGRAVAEGGMSLGAHGVGRGFGWMGQRGKDMISSVVAPKAGPHLAKTMTDTAIAHGARLTPESLKRMTRESVELENLLGPNAPRVQNLDQLIAQLRQTPNIPGKIPVLGAVMHRGGGTGRISGGGDSMLSTRNILRVGEALEQGARYGRPLTEGTLRALLAAMMGMREDVTDEGPQFGTDEMGEGIEAGTPPQFGPAPPPGPRRRRPEIR